MANLFVKQAGIYAKSRPDYPASLFQMLASVTHRHEKAWDAGTGNGQAAVMIADHYSSVIATDVSDAQLSHAAKRDNISYVRLSPVPIEEEVERVVGSAGSVDLVTVAQALHWFDLEKFYPIVKKVLRKPGGVFAAWCYTLPRVNTEIDAVLDNLKNNVQAPYWDAKRKFVDDEYRSIAFPFEPVLLQNGKAEVGPHQLESVKQWTFEEYFLYAKSCSAVQTALDQGVNIMNEDIGNTFLSVWGAPNQVRTVRFPIFMLVGTVPKA